MTIEQSSNTIYNIDVDCATISKYNSNNTSWYEIDRYTSDKNYSIYQYPVVSNYTPIFSAFISPQDNLNNDFASKILFQKEHVNTILGASIDNSSILLPIGTYYITFSFIIVPLKNNTQIGIGFNINSEALQVQSTEFNKWEGKQATMSLSRTVVLYCESTLELYSVKLGKPGKVFSVYNSGSIDILKVA